MLHKIDDQTLLLLNRLLGDASQLVPCVETNDDSHEVFSRVDLPVALGGDYFFGSGFMKMVNDKLSLNPEVEDGFIWIS